MEQVTTDWKKQLKYLHLRDIEKRYPDAFRLSGGYKQRLKPYKDTTANGLTKCIIDFIRYNGGDAQRINTTGIYRKVNGQMKWTHSGMRRGTADIHAIIKGKAVSIEIKIGKDRMSEFQHKERERIEKAGGLYFMAKDMPDFIKWYQSNFEIGVH
ncbi:MAG: hypothetical protein EPN37_12295 [Chitinophagaceae bacterium]|nr:MAG: hypothetical protein EPN37_12295 [Chitinophagaceae bacterium]